MNNNIIELRNLLSTIGPNSCPGIINLHTHTIYSDGSLDPQSIIEIATQNNLQHISITDHNSISAYPQLISSIKKQISDGYTPPKLWTGIEISCTLKNCLVHMLGIGFELNNKSMSKYINGEACIGVDLKAESVINAIHKANGLAILAHPARYRLGHHELISYAERLGCDGAEAWYDYEHKPIWSPTPYICNAINEQLNDLNMLSTCGTDSHGYNLTGR